MSCNGNSPQARDLTSEKETQLGYWTIQTHAWACDPSLYLERCSHARAPLHELAERQSCSADAVLQPPQGRRLPPRVLTSANVCGGGEVGQGTCSMQIMVYVPNVGFFLAGETIEVSFPIRIINT